MALPQRVRRTNGGDMGEGPNPVVVGYDGSADSERAFTWAVATAKQRRRPLRLVAVLDYGAPEWLPDRVEEARSRAAEELSNVGDQPGGLTLTVLKPRHEEASHALLRLSEDAHLVVLGSHGHSALAGMFIGSVSQHLGRHAPCPVVVVRERHDSQARRIVVGSDYSEGSDRALEFAFDAAERTGAPLTVIHGWQHSTAGRAGLYLPLSTTVAQEIDTRRAELRDSLAGWIEKHPGVAVEWEAIPLHPIRVLSDASEHAALVVVGSRGHGAFMGMLLGSVSLGVLHQARCPVAIAR
jgi:nucleotide-binding universal stress UspA family protein